MRGVLNGTGQPVYPALIVSKSLGANMYFKRERRNLNKWLKLLQHNQNKRKIEKDSTDI
jgi:hypothetical protein